ncbi:MAG: Uma2 family endonuclease [Chloroflexota bacterium]|nr:Uma2 family endonuclease [Chloroflexota bacterium]MDE2959465.1 Uma2 family endonuclease [Chloroflexota bacterium]
MVSKTARPQVPDEDEIDDPTIEYPSSDGEPMAESEAQYTPLTETVSTLRVRYHEHEDVYVGGDMLIYYRMNRNDVRVAPDVFVVFGVTSRHPRDSWLVWREGRAPDFIMEIASSRTWRRDATEKRRIYADMGVTEYVRFDPTGNYFTPALVLERLDGAEYREQPLTTGDDGNLRAHSVMLGLDLAVAPDLTLRLYDPATGEWLRTHQESEFALQDSEAALQASEAGRQAAEAEVARLREQLAHLRQQT